MIGPRRMMPVHSGGASKRVCVDANAVIDYIRECALRDLGMPPTGRRQDALRKSLEQARHVFVAKTAGVEAQQNLAKDVGQKLGSALARDVTAHAEELLHEYRRKVECGDSLDYVSAARAMYDSISADPGNRKLAKWKKKKGVFVADPVLGSDANDLTILSTAAHYARQYAVELWTHDMDFTVFSDEIWRAFGVKVVDSHRLGGRYGAGRRLLAPV